METTTSYLGLKLEHPFIAGASPMSYRLESIKRLEDAGCAAVVLHSLFEEQISYACESRIARANVFDPECAGVVGAFPGPSDYPMGPDAYAEHIARAKASTAIPIIASLNGRTAESWLTFARVIEQAGADALELNTYDVAADLTTPGAAIEQQLVEVVRELKRVLRIPVAVKLSPFYTAFGHVARQLDAAGADGLVLFNRFYQPDIDIRTRSLNAQAELSSSAELPLRLRWLAILFGRVRPSLAVSGGVADPDAGVQALLAGADVIQMVSALLRHGPTFVGEMRRGLESWLSWNNVGTLSEVRGSVSLHATADASSFERAQYIHTLHSWTS